MHSENQSKGVHYAKSQRLLEINHAHLQLMESLLDEGKKHIIFKPDIDPLQVNINIAALGGYYLINQHTLGLVYPVRQYPSSANTLNNSKHLVRWKTAPYIPALKDGVLRRTG